jgi:NAD(P)-dependent dehydrogenase (short-subunit alcohol dehydrogenase family)
MGDTLKGQKVLLTGASSGIGADLAVGLAAEGAVVGICARREGELAQVLARCREHSPESRMWVVDLSRLDEVTAFALRADDELDGIDVLVNNAGIPKRRHALRLTPEEAEAVMAVNYFSPVRMTLALLPRMVERGGGRIVSVSSVAARFSPPRESAYAASKAALSTFMESIAVDLWDDGIRVHLVYPGVIDTPIFHLPDNEPMLAEVDSLPASEVTAAVIEQLRVGTFEVYVPPYFADIVAGKNQDVGKFLEGTAGWAREAARQRKA